MRTSSLRPLSCGLKPMSHSFRRIRAAASSVRKEVNYGFTKRAQVRVPARAFTAPDIQPSPHPGRGDHDTRRRRVCPAERSRGASLGTAPARCGPLRDSSGRATPPLLPHGASTAGPTTDKRTPRVIDDARTPDSSTCGWRLQPQSAKASSLPDAKSGGRVPAAPHSPPFVSASPPHRRAAPRAGPGVPCSRTRPPRRRRTPRQ